MAHPNIVHLHRVLQDNKFIYLLVDHVEGCSVQEFTARKLKLSEGQVRRITEQLLSALEFIS